MVEFAIVFPILTILVFGAFDFGRALLAHNSLTNAAREGARFGITHPTQVSSADAADPNNVQWHIVQELKNATVTVTAANISVYYVKNDGTTLDATTGRSTYLANTGIYPFLRVDVRYTYQPMTPLIGSIMGSGASLVSSTTMAIE
jgi:Flp pilus assembly protein TadG